LFLLIFGLQRFKKLKNEDEFAFSMSPEQAATPISILQNLLQEGPPLGIHIWMSCDAFGNVQRFLGRKMLGEFDMRVAFQMSAADSSSFLDSPKASTLGLNRALFSNEQQGCLETFRPYALPDSAWEEEAAARLA
jgi:DNA segregation ATPase FtsK/SpoIIIE, S-DNA-T family